jgi:hypothetical protein
MARFGTNMARFGTKKATGTRLCYQSTRLKIPADTKKIGTIHAYLLRDNFILSQPMNGQIDFDCHDFFDNTNLCILEISLPEDGSNGRRYEWLLISKENLSIKRMLLRNRDSSSSVQERFFDLGFLKFDTQSGVFIEAAAKDLHHLEHKGCEDIPKDYLYAVNAYLIENLVT